MRIRWGWSPGLILGLMIFATGAHAAGTASGTTVSNIATVAWLSNGSPGETTTPSIDTTVLRIGGDTLADPGNQTMGPGDTKIYTYTFANTGNASDTFNLWIDQFTLSGGAVNWTFTFYLGSNVTSTLNDTKVSALLAADGNLTCSVAVWAHNLIANSPDGSRAEFRLRIASGLRPNDVEYVGDNNIAYSLGGAQNNDTSWATVASANITLAKVVTSVTTGGAASMPKPGATILYTLTYNNAGSAAGDSVVVRDSIPLNCFWDSASRQNTNLGASATLVDNDTGATGWQLQVTTNTNPNNAYLSADWTDIQYFAGAANTVKWVRWRRQSVAATQTATLRFRVIIQ